MQPQIFPQVKKIYLKKSGSEVTPLIEYTYETGHILDIPTNSPYPAPT